MKSWLVTFTSKQQFLEVLRTESLREYWKLTPITSYDFEQTDQILQQSPRDFSFAAITYIAALFGIGVGFFMQYYSAVEDTPLDIGGRPLNSWPAFIPITFILMILFAAISLFGFFFWRLRLPWPSHPLFFAKSFSLDKKQYQIMFEGQNPIENLQFSGATPQIEELL